VKFVKTDFSSEPPQILYSKLIGLILKSIEIEEFININKELVSEFDSGSNVIISLSISSKKHPKFVTLVIL
jgi:hypothetical protein